MSKLTSAHQADQLSIVDFATSANNSLERSTGFIISSAPGGSDVVLIWSAFSALLGALAASLWREEILANFVLLALLAIFIWLLQTLLRARLASKLAGVTFVTIAFLMTGLRQAELTQHQLDYLLGEHVTMSGRISCIDASQDRLTISDAVILESDTKSFKIASLVPVMLAPGVLNESSLSSNSCLGQTITVRGVFSRPTDQCFSFQGKPSSYLASRGVYFQLSRAYPDRHSQLALQSHSNFSDWSGFCLQIVDFWRKYLLSFFKCNLSDTAAQLIASMVMGDRAVALASALKLSFNKVGLSHLLAASGMNLTIILGFILALSGRLQKLRAPLFCGVNGFKHIELAVCVFSVLGFSLLAGSSPSVFRATVMCLIALFARCIFRQITAVRALAMALLLSIWLSPVSVFDIGLQLSYAATFGVLCLYPLIDASLKLILPLPGKLGRGLVSIIAIVLAAQCAVLPLQLYYFGQLSTVFLLANTLAEPLVAPVTVLGFIATLLVSPYTIVSFFSTSTLGASPLVAPLAALTRLLLLPASWICLAAAPLIQLLLFVVERLASLPLSTIVVARPALPIVLLSYGLLLLLVFVDRSDSQPKRFWQPQSLGFVVLAKSIILVFCCQLFAPSLEILSGRDFFCLRRTGQFILLKQSASKGTAGSCDNIFDPTLRAYLRSRSEPLRNLTDLSHYSDQLVDYRWEHAEGAEQLLLLLKKDNLNLIASRQGRAPYAISCQSLAGTVVTPVRFRASPSSDFIAVTGDLAFSRCLPYLDWALPLYPTLSCRVEQIASRYLLSFAL